VLLVENSSITKQIQKQMVPKMHVHTKFEGKRKILKFVLPGG